MDLQHLSPEFIADIFGKHVGNTFYAGLVDSASLGEFDEHFECLKPVWELRESTCMPTSEPRFYNYFSQYQANVVRYHEERPAGSLWPGISTSTVYNKWFRVNQCSS